MRPFHNGSQFADWRILNCDSCKRSVDNKKSGGSCDIEEALDVACLTDGNVSNEIGVRMGATDPIAYTWKCPEYEGIVDGLDGVVDRNEFIGNIYVKPAKSIDFTTFRFIVRREERI